MSDKVHGEEATVVVIDEEVKKSENVLVVGDTTDPNVAAAVAKAASERGGVVVPIEFPKNNAEIEVDHKEVASYLRLQSIYEGDIELERGQFISAFILRMTDLQGTVFMCPIYTPDNLRESVRKSMSRLKPVILSQFDKEAPIKTEASAEIIDITNCEHNNNNTH